MRELLRNSRLNLGNDSEVSQTKLSNVVELWVKTPQNIWGEEKLSKRLNSMERTTLNLSKGQNGQFVGVLVSSTTKKIADTQGSERSQGVGT